MSVYTLAALTVIDAASACASESIGENVCAIAGRSVLSEYQQELFKRYGIFLVRNSERFFEEKAFFYINGSLIGKRGIVRFKGAVVDLDMSAYPGTDTAELKRQINKVALGVNEYILGYFSSYTKGLTNTYLRNEVEKIVCGKDTDAENLEAMKEKLISLRFAINIATLNKEDIDVSAIGTMIETVIPGHLDDAAVEVSQALEQARRDADVILGGGNVPIISSSGRFGRYEDYLRVFLALTPEDLKFYRMMRIMETNIRSVDMILFSFSDYAYGFEMKILLTRRPVAGLFSIGKDTVTFVRVFRYK